jgi:hypothetical protein
MSSFFVLTGVLMLMASSIRIIGEALKTDVLMGIIALLAFPFFTLYATFFADYQKYHRPFFTGLGGTCLVLVGYAMGLS